MIRRIQHFDFPIVGIRLLLLKRAVSNLCGAISNVELLIVSGHYCSFFSELHRHWNIDSAGTQRHNLLHIFLEPHTDHHSRGFYMVAIDFPYLPSKAAKISSWIAGTRTWRLAHWKPAPLRQSSFLGTRFVLFRSYGSFWWVKAKDGQLDKDHTDIISWFWLCIDITFSSNLEQTKWNWWCSSSGMGWINKYSWDMWYLHVIKKAQERFQTKLEQRHLWILKPLVCDLPGPICIQLHIYIITHNHTRWWTLLWCLPKFCPKGTRRGLKGVESNTEAIAYTEQLKIAVPKWLLDKDQVTGSQLCQRFC